MGACDAARCWRWWSPWWAAWGAERRQPPAACPATARDRPARPARCAACCSRRRERRDRARGDGVCAAGRLWPRTIPHRLRVAEETPLVAAPQPQAGDSGAAMPSTTASLNHLNIYSAAFGLPARRLLSTGEDGCLQKINMAAPSGSARLALGGISRSRRTSRRSTICQNCRIVPVESVDDTFETMAVAENRAAQAGNIVSNSYGGYGVDGYQSRGTRYWDHPCNKAIVVCRATAATRRVAAGRAGARWCRWAARRCTWRPFRATSPRRRGGANATYAWGPRLGLRGRALQRVRADPRGDAPGGGRGLCEHGLWYQPGGENDACPPTPTPDTCTGHVRQVNGVPQDRRHQHRGAADRGHVRAQGGNMTKAGGPGIVHLREGRHFGAPPRHQRLPTTAATTRRATRPPPRALPRRATTCPRGWDRHTAWVGSSAVRCAWQVPGTGRSRQKRNRARDERGLPVRRGFSGERGRGRWRRSRSCWRSASRAAGARPDRRRGGQRGAGGRSSSRSARPDA